MKQSLLVIIIIAFLSLAIDSCTSKIDLSNSEALEIIKQGYKRYCEKAVHSSTYHNNNQQPLPVLAHLKTSRDKDLSPSKKTNGIIEVNHLI
ncbi:hypothetical protein [Dokdonia sp.]|uniref:hypothetical protein n=1 Tax=Dokdonia sp. TaxID=2024995 RepID=UPI003265C61B